MPKLSLKKLRTSAITNALSVASLVRFILKGWMMENKNFKVGQVWRNRGGEIRTILKVDKLNPFYHIFDTGDRSYTKDGSWCSLAGTNVWDLIELVKDVEDKKMEEELTLEVGTEYDLPNSAYNPYLFIIRDSDNYLFRNSAGILVEYKVCHLEGIKEHRESYKNIAELWIETSSHCNNQTIETYLTGLKGVIAFGKDQYINTHGGVLKKYRITTEEITENSADD